MDYCEEIELSNKAKKWNGKQSKKNKIKYFLAGSFIAWMVFVAVLGLICIIFFRPKLRRMALDVGANARAQLKEDEEESEFKM